MTNDRFRKLLLLLVIVHSSSVVASATTVTGTIKDAAGNNLASGKILLRLSQEGTVSDPALILALSVSCDISNGAIQSCAVRGNDAISPAGTFYRVRIITASGQELLPERRYTITGSSWDIGQQTPLASDTIAAQAYQTVQDESMSLIQQRTLNFTGSAVTCTDDPANDRTSCSITGGGAGSTHQIDGVNLASQDPINFQDTSEIDWTNPSAGNLQAALKTESVLPSKIDDSAASSTFALFSGGAGAPSFRAIADADVPNTLTLDNLTQITSRNYSDLQNRQHALVGSDHSASGLTIGWVPRATGPTSFAWGAVQPADLGSAFLDALTDLAGSLCGTNEILEDQGASWACIPTPTGGGGNHNLLSSTHPDTAPTSVALGDVIYGNSTPAWARLAGNTTTTKMFLSQTGTGTASAAPAWAQPAFADLSGSATKAQLPPAAAYEDEANIFTAAGGVTLDNQLGLRLREATASGTEYVEHRATSALAASVTYTWPAVTADRFLFTDSSGGLSWNPASGVGACTDQVVTATNNNAAPTCSNVSTAMISDNAVSDAKLRDSTATSVIGRSAGTTGDPADIQATADDQVFRRSGGTLGFGTITGNSFGSQSANTVLAAPDGSAGNPSFRALADGDIPAAVTRDVEWPSASATLTNKTLDVEGTGNVITTVSKHTFIAAGCNNATAGPGWDIPISNGPTASCYGTSPQRFGGLDFADGAAALTSTTHLRLPSDWTGAIDVAFIWFSGSTSTNSAVWTLATACIADGEGLLAPTFNTTQTVADANNATANTRNSATISSITTTGCAASETLFLRIGRDPTNGSDTLAATAVLLEFEITLRRAQ